MAILHRMLFPFLSSPPNLPAPCPDFCDPSCSNFQDCYLLPDPGLIPPEPSPPPPAPPPDNQVFHIPFAAIIVIVVLASLFLLVSYFAVFTKWARFGIRSNPDPRISEHPETDDELNRELDGRDQLVDHPIWLISTVGLQQSVIDSITVIKYKKEEGLFEGSDCSVCLSEFQEGESLRLLPECNHAFHIDCIDTWLRSHTNCPLCRAGIVVDPDGPSLGPNDLSFGDSRRSQLIQMAESASNDVELGSSLTRDGGGMEENRVETGGGSEQQVSRSVSMNFFPGWNSRNLGDPNFQRNPKWSSFRMMGSSSSSSWRALGSNQVERSYSWSEKVFGSTRYQKRNLDPESSS